MNESIKEGKDLYFLQETFTDRTANIGLILLKCTEDVYTFFKGIRDEVLRDGTHDQLITNNHLKTTSLTWEFFDQSCMKSNMMNNININTFLLCQFLCYYSKYEHSMAEKLNGYLSLISLEPYLSYIDPNIQAYLADISETFKFPIPSYIIYRIKYTS
jgi:hypothetical protein